MERPAVLLLSGLLCDTYVWTQQTEALAGEAEVTPVDFHGFASIAAMAESVLDRAPPRFAVVGHSMGGRVALEVIRRAPERVTRLALLDTGTHPARPGEAEKRQELIDLAHQDGMAALAARWLPPMVHPDRLQDGPFMLGLMEMVGRATPAIFEGQVRALLGRPDANPGLSGIRVPTLIACGREDVWSPLSQHEPIHAAIPGSTLAVVERSGHMTTVEAPEAVSDLLRAWLRAD